MCLYFLTFAQYVSKQNMMKPCLWTWLHNESDTPQPLVYTDLLKMQHIKEKKGNQYTQLVYMNIIKSTCYGPVVFTNNVTVH